jgi:hypothetical protein
MPVQSCEENNKPGYNMKIITKSSVYTNERNIYGKMVGIITNIQIKSDFNELIISYKYKNDRGDTFIEGNYTLNGEDIDTISDEVKGIIDIEYYNLPDRVRLNLKYYGMFIILTSKKFDIKPTDIEIIDTDLFEYK